MAAGLLFKIYLVAAAGILLWRRGSFVVLVCEEGVWLQQCNRDVFNEVHSRCWCLLCHVITLDRHCVVVLRLLASSVEV